MSHPAQARYGACTAINKHGQPCGLPIVRGGRCGYHQPEEIEKRLLAKLRRNGRERDVITEELRKLQMP